jgi:tRNA nucleotidyltransferase (CCA-adding enzyme)
MSSGDAVIAALRGQPGGEELFELAAQGHDIELVGGAVRDLLLERTPRELDVVVAADAGAFAHQLARALEQAGRAPTLVSAHERFGTASVQWSEGRVDVASRRAESYPAPGALPEIREGTVEEDLARRDFTVNALAVPLGSRGGRELLFAEHALEDLAASRLRVLHERSFIDDPTRLLRLGRYRARLGFQPEPHTATLAAEALAAGAFATVSGARVGAELRLALEEPDPLEALASLEDLGVLGAIAPALSLDRTLAERALALLPEDGRAAELLLACLLLGPTRERGRTQEAVEDLLDELEFTAGERDRVARNSVGAPELAERLGLARRPSELRQLLAAHPLEGVALAGALGELAGAARAGAQARTWIEQLRHVRLEITGEDLLAAGLQPGPQIGQRLKAALSSKLDGELPAEDPSAELRAALEARV